MSYKKYFTKLVLFIPIFVLLISFAFAGYFSNVQAGGGPFISVNSFTLTCTGTQSTLTISGNTTEAYVGIQVTTGIAAGNPNSFYLVDSYGGNGPFATTSNGNYNTGSIVFPAQPAGTLINITVYGTSVAAPGQMTLINTTTGVVAINKSFMNQTCPSTYTATTNTPTSSSSSSSGPSGNSGNHNEAKLAPACSDMPPTGSPDLFQVTRSGKTATLSFTPISSATYYYIAYGYAPGEERFGVEITFPNNDGVKTFTINALNPNMKYYFKVRAGSGCAPGAWSNNNPITPQLPNTGRGKTGK
jgi:hypothetical protein